MEKHFIDHYGGRVIGCCIGFDVIARVIVSVIAVRVGHGYRVTVGRFEHARGETAGIGVGHERVAVKPDIGAVGCQGFIQYKLGLAENGLYSVDARVRTGGNHKGVPIAGGDVQVLAGHRPLRQHSVIQFHYFLSAGG